ncbi:MAG: isoprenylcysteine carboxylmethyltransferase family protein [Bacteroidales bacterium]|nr:isoprenylcysteine carboxylmethyltransferase family protein [Bacteroidales bacterium]
MALREELKTQGDFLFRYRSYFPLLLLVCGLALIVVGALKGGPESMSGHQAWMEDPAIFVSLLGLAIRIHAVGFSGRNTSGRNTGQGQIAEMLNTKGLYSITRNPLYVGNYFMWLGIAMLTCNLWFVAIFTLIFWIYYERIVFAEEEFLREKFGDDYLNWTAETPIFIPFKLQWQKSGSPFLWRKVLKQEKNGFLALFLVFFLFDLVASSLEQQQWAISKSWLLVMLVVSALIYLLIKLLKKRF